MISRRALGIGVAVVGIPSGTLRLGLENLQLAGTTEEVGNAPDVLARRRCFGALLNTAYYGTLCMG